MLTIFRTAIRLLASRWRRMVSLLCLIALLSLTAGLLGSSLLYGDAPIDALEIAVVNQDGSAESRLAYSLLSGAFEDTLINMRVLGEKQALRLLEQGKVNAVFYIPEGFVQSIISGQNEPLRIAFNRFTPVKSSLIRLFADTYLGQLRSSQLGIYAALDYTRAHAPQEYDQVLRGINTRYITLAISLSRLEEETVLSATGRASPFVHYTASALVLLLMLGCALFAPTIQNNFGAPTLSGLRRLGVPPLKTAGGWALAWWAWFLPLGVLCAAALAVGGSAMGESISLLIIAGVAVVCLWLGALGSACSFVCRSSTGATALLCVYGTLSYLLAGGALPLSFFPGWLQNAAMVFPSYWAVELLEGAAMGELLPLPMGVLVLFALAFWGIAALGIRRNMRGRRSL